MSFTLQDEIARHFYKIMWISREIIFGPDAEDETWPIHMCDDAECVFPGYLGARYESGGTLLLGINTGGGSDSYKTRNSADAFLYPLLKWFKESATDEVLSRFLEMNKQFERQFDKWNLWRIIEPVLIAAGIELNQAAFINAVPFRTRNNRTPSVIAQSKAWKNITSGSIRCINPSLIIPLGKKAGRFVERFYTGRAQVVVVPRTQGDRYVSDEAQHVLSVLAYLTKVSSLKPILPTQGQRVSGNIQSINTQRNS